MMRLITTCCILAAIALLAMGVDGVKIETGPENQVDVFVSDKDKLAR